MLLLLLLIIVLYCSSLSGDANNITKPIMNNITNNMFIPGAVSDSDAPRPIDSSFF